MRPQCLPYPHHCLLIIPGMVSTVIMRSLVIPARFVTVLLAGTSVTLVFMETDYALWHSHKMLISLALTLAYLLTFLHFLTLSQRSIFIPIVLVNVNLPQLKIPVSPRH